MEIYRCLDCNGVLAIGTPRCPRCGGTHMRPLRNDDHKSAETRPSPPQASRISHDPASRRARRA